MIKALINVRLYDFESYIHEGYMLFDETILEVGSMKDFKNQDYEIIDGKHDVIIPGLVNGHTHIYSTFARGLSVHFNPKDFQGILDDLWWKIDRVLTKEMIYYSGIVHAVDSIKNGVTTLIDHHASGADIIGTLKTLKEAVSDTVGLRGAYAFETSDRFDVEKCIDENISFLNQYKTPYCRGFFGLHASMSLSEETLKKVSEKLNKAPIHIHVAESILDQEDALKKYQERVVHRLNRHKLLNKNSIITHAIHVNDEELDLIKETGCVIAVNINSNMNNGVGIPDVSRFTDKKIPVIIGNDGISSTVTTEYLSLLYGMHHLHQTPLRFNLDHLKHVVQTIYRYISELFEVKIGKFKPTYQADFIRIPYQSPTPINQDNAFGHLFFGMFHSFKPKDVYIGGKLKVKDGKLESSVENLYQEAQEVALKHWNKVKEEESRCL